MANELIILLVFIFTFSMFIVGMIFNKIWGLKRADFKEFREKISNLQERMKNAQITGDLHQMRQLQLESNRLFKIVMTKQLLPSCSRCILFLIVWVILDTFVFFNYRTGLLPFIIPVLGDGWVALYFLFSIGLLIVFYASKKLYFKITGKEVKKSSMFRQLLGDQSYTNIDNIKDSGSSDNWKEKI